MNTLTRRMRMTIAVSILFLCRNFAIAQLPAIDKEAETILTNYISAIGGVTALSKIENIVSKSDLSIMEAGVTINREMVQDKANNLYIKAYALQTGELYRGFDGDIFWEKNKSSIREIDAENRLTYLNEFAFMRFANWKKNLIEFEYQGKDSIDGIVFHCIEIKTKYGVKENWYFDTTNYLLRYTKEQLEMTKGIVTVVTKYDDYREIEGVKHSFTQTVRLGERIRKIEYSSILHNQLIDKKIFSKPIIN